VGLLLGFVLAQDEESVLEAGDLAGDLGAVGDQL
jgi:hypothetical protein